MKTEQLIIVAGASAAILYMVYQSMQEQNQQDPTQDPNAPQAPVDTQPSLIDSMISTTSSMLGLWHPPAKYADAIATAEATYNLPQDLLARLLYQESRYREDIITGKTRSPVGALGIAQFMPATASQLGIDALDPFQAIDGAGRYMASLYRQTGNWTEALAAYNWGIGNVKRKGIANAPAETQKYFTQILADVNSSTGQTLA